MPRTIDDHPHRYYVSYAFGNGLTAGFGAHTVGRDAPISNDDDLKDLLSFLRDATGLTGIIILNWQRFED